MKKFPFSLTHIIQIVIIFISLIFLGFNFKDAHADSVLHANPNFPKDYYLMTGQSYPKGYSDLTYKLLNVKGQLGLFYSDEATVDYIDVINLTGLPEGLNYDQLLDVNRPLTNTLRIFGTIPSTISPGVYAVTITGKDEDLLQVSEPPQVIYFHIGASAPPSPKQDSLEVNAKINEQVSVANMSQYFDAPAGSIIDSYKVIEIKKLPPGITFNSTGDFVGHYEKAGRFQDVKVEAHNQAGWSAPLTINFTVVEPGTVPTPITPTLSVSGKVGESIHLQNMSYYFEVSEGSPAIDLYQIINQEKIPPGISFVPTGDFQGSYHQTGTFSDVKVQAHNAIGWSAPMTINFSVSESLAPFPVQDSLQIFANLGEPAKIKNMSHYFQVPEGSPSIDNYEIVDMAKLPPEIQFLSSGDFKGTYLQIGEFSDVKIRAHNPIGWSTPLTIQFTISNMAPLLTCPKISLISAPTPPAEVMVTDSSGRPYTFKMGFYLGLVNGFYAAELKTNAKYPNGLVCQYTSGSAVGPTIMYYLENVPQGTFLSNNPLDTRDTCQASYPEACEFHIPSLFKFHQNNRSQKHVIKSKT